MLIGNKESALSPSPRGSLFCTESSAFSLGVTSTNLRHRFEWAKLDGMIIVEENKKKAKEGKRRGG